MPDIDDELDDAADEPQEQPTGEAPKVLRKQNAKLTKELDELRKQLTEFQTQAQRAKIADQFRERGVPDKVAKFYSGDDSPEAIGKWIEDNADVFGIDLGTDDPPDDTRQAVTKIREASAAPSAPQAKLVATGDPKAGSPEELLALYRDPNISAERLQELGLITFGKRMSQTTSGKAV